MTVARCPHCYSAFGEDMIGKNCYVCNTANVVAVEYYTCGCPVVVDHYCPFHHKPIKAPQPKVKEEL